MLVRLESAGRPGDPVYVDTTKVCSIERCDHESVLVFTTGTRSIVAGTVDEVARLLGYTGIVA